ncbi:unnamed protein product [Amaranthus hypochondriacus]
MLGMLFLCCLLICTFGSSGFILFMRLNAESICIQCAAGHDAELSKEAVRITLSCYCLGSCLYADMVMLLGMSTAATEAVLLLLAFYDAKTPSCCYGSWSTEEVAIYAGNCSCCLTTRRCS